MGKQFVNIYRWAGGLCFGVSESLYGVFRTVSSVTSAGELSSSGAAARATSFITAAATAAHLLPFTQPLPARLSSVPTERRGSGGVPARLCPLLPSRWGLPDVQHLLCLNAWVMVHCEC